MTRDEIRAGLPDRVALLCTLDAEARGEPLIGQIGVACVIRNRVESGHWGRSYASACLAKWQFSCWWGDDANSDRTYALAIDLQRDTPIHAVDVQLHWIADGLLSGALREDVTKAATHYLTRALYRSKPPAWAKGASILAELGHHVFLRAA